MVLSISSPEVCHDLADVSLVRHQNARVVDAQVWIRDSYFGLHLTPSISFTMSEEPVATGSGFGPAKIPDRTCQPDPDHPGRAAHRGMA